MHVAVILNGKVDGDLVEAIVLKRSQRYEMDSDPKSVLIVWKKSKTLILMLAQKLQAWP
jgi:hypothetical protein